jgi:hypothetical protein
MFLISRNFYERERTRLYVHWICTLFPVKLHIVQNSPFRCTNCTSFMNVANEVTGRWPRSFSSASFMHGPTFVRERYRTQKPLRSSSRSNTPAKQPKVCSWYMVRTHTKVPALRCMIRQRGNRR